MVDKAGIFELGPDGTLHIPETVRKAQGWQPGQRFAVVNAGEGYVIVAVPTADDLFGAMRGANPDGYRERDEGAE